MSSAPLAGQTLDGRFVLERPLGAGGQAAVYLARDLARQCAVAVKLLAPDHLTDQDLLRRFRLEFDACCRVEHPNVVRLILFGQSPDGAPYLAMEYLEGRNLAQELEARGPFDEALALGVLRQVGAALEAIHAHEIVHRDLKPANVMLVRSPGAEPRAVLMDFGLARQLDLTAFTATGAVLGTPLYLAPEAAKGARVDRRADVWQVGCLAYELLTGSVAFGGSSLQEVFHRIMDQAPAPLAEVRPELTGRWQPFIDGCLAKDPAKRIQGARQLLLDLERVAAPAEAQRPRGPKRQLATAAHEALTPAPPPRRPAAAAAALLLLALLAGLAATRLRTPPAPAPYTAEDLVVTPGLDCLVVSWTSERPYPSRLSLLRPTPLEVDGSDPEPTTRHRVVVPGLAPGTPYTFVLRYPSGEASLPKTAVTSAAAVELLPATLQGRSLRVAWRGAAGGPARLVATLPGGEERTVEAAGGQATLPDGLRPETTELSLVLGAATVPLSRSLERQVVAAVRRLGRFDPAEAMKGLARDILESPVAAVDRLAVTSDAAQRELDERLLRGEVAARAYLRTTATERLRASGVLDDYATAAGLAPLALGTELLPLARRLELHDRLQAVWSIRLFTAFEEAPVEVVAAPPWGEFGLSTAQNPALVDETTVLRADGDPLVFSQILPFRPSKAVHRHEATFQVRDAAGLRAAELRFDLEPFRNIVLRAFLNDGPEVLLHCIPTLVSPTAPPPAVSLYQRLPARALREGQNRLLLRFDALYGRGNGNPIRLRRVTLRTRRAP